MFLRNICMTVNETSKDFYFSHDDGLTCIFLGPHVAYVTAYLEILPLSLTFCFLIWNGPPYHSTGSSSGNSTNPDWEYFLKYYIMADMYRVGRPMMVVFVLNIWRLFPLLLLPKLYRITIIYIVFSLCWVYKSSGGKVYRRICIASTKNEILYKGLIDLGFRGSSETDPPQILN